MNAWKTKPTWSRRTRVSWVSELWGGQQQRVALARALVARPDVIFADEATGALDSTTGAEVLGLLRRSVDEWGQTVVMVTHDANAAAVADRVILLADGQVAGELLDPDADAVLCGVGSAWWPGSRCSRDCWPAWCRPGGLPR